MARNPFAVAAFLLALGSPSLSHAQASYPDKPVRIIVPFAAGGVADLLPRIVGEKLTRKWGQPVVVENKTGAAGNIGMAEGARAAPDGYTLVLAPAGNLTVNPKLFPNLPFDTHVDLTPVTLLAQSPNVLVVHPSVPAKTFPELLAYARANPGKLNYASQGTGTTSHLTAELLQTRTGIKLVHVPYKGTAPAVNDLVAGHVDLMFESLNGISSAAKSAQVRPLAVSGDKRSLAFPDLPTVAEAGVPGYSAPTWSSLVGPAGLPKEIVDKLNTALNKAIQTPGFKSRFAAIGDEAAGGTPQDLADTIARDSAKWKDVVARSNAKLD